MPCEVGPHFFKPQPTGMRLGVEPLKRADGIAGERKLSARETVV